MITFIVKDGILVLTYTTENPWVLSKLKLEDEINLKKGVFHFSKADILSSSDIEETDLEEVNFILGKSEEDYFCIEGRKLGIKQYIYIHKDLKVTESFFIGIRSNAIFRDIGNIVDGNIFIGGKKDGAISGKDFLQLLREFPNNYELNNYIRNRQASVLENYFESAVQIRGKYESYMNKRLSTQGENLQEAFKETELLKYEAILSKLELMLQDENKYNEKQWQREILQIILLLYPKYIYAFEEAPIRDFVKGKDRKIDFILVDSNGNVDIIEIKRPMDDKIITKTQYRDNHIPLKELSGTVMQVEKYIYHLNKSGQAGENKLTTKYKKELPLNFKIKITNPGGFIIMGRENSLSPEQKEDFEVVKRKYKNVLDIITYDDLVRRLKFIIEAWKNKI